MLRVLTTLQIDEVDEIVCVDVYSEMEVLDVNVRQ